LAALKVSFTTVPSVSKAAAVVTGDEAEGTTPAAPTLRWTDKPILVYVCSEAGCEESEVFENQVLKIEKVALSTKAFRCVRMTPDQVDEDAILKDNGKTVPRVLLVEPVKMKIDVVETKDMKAGKLAKAMEKTSGKFWKERLKTVIGAHLKMLTKQDQLSNALKTLAAKEARYKDDEAKLKKVAAEIKETNEELAELKKAQVELWKLTPKNTSA
jgi:hypothetical protein